MPPEREIASSTLSPAALTVSLPGVLTSPSTVNCIDDWLTSVTTACGSIARFVSFSTMSRWIAGVLRLSTAICPA